MSQLSDIKSEIKTNLDELVSVGTLGEVIEDDYKLGIFERDFAAYPAAILTVPAIGNNYLTNRQNIREYTYQVVVVMNGENIASASDVENLIEAIINKFDNDPTLNGKADGGVEPSTSAPEAAVSRGKTYIAFAINIKCRAVKDLSF